MTATSEIEFLAHKRVQLALHHLRRGDGGTLLLLHGLGERTPATVPSWLEPLWPGPIAGIDFTGHGLSTLPTGGGYTCEVLLADADTALEALGPLTVLGRGLGAYVALLLAGARPAGVMGAVLMDGPGLSGGGDGPIVGPAAWAPPEAKRTPDPYALIELSTDLRPSDYAAQFARQAVALSPLDAPISVVAGLRPPWVQAVAAEHGVVISTVDEALNRYARIDRP